MSDKDRSDLWIAINHYAETCGWYTSTRTVSIERQEVVAAIESIVSRIERAAVNRCLGYALNSGDGVYRP